MKIKKIYLIITTCNSTEHPEPITYYSYGFEYENITYINLENINNEQT